VDGQADVTTHLWFYFMHNTYKSYDTGQVVIIINSQPNFMEINSSKYTIEGHK